MLRLAPIVLVVALLGATAAAFAVTEGLKLTPSPIRSTLLDRTVFSPVCRCDRATVHLRFRLRKADSLSLVVVDRSRRVVRTLIAGRRFSRGLHSFRWNGRDDDGAVVPDGVYKPRVHLARQHRTILLPNPIRVDTKPPTATMTVTPRLLEPGRARAKVLYRLSEPAQAILYANGRRVVGPSRFHPQRGKLDWYASRLPAGTYRLTLRGLDLAGNLGPATPAVTVHVVQLRLARHVVRVRRRARFAVGFVPAGAVHWRFAGGNGVAHGTVVRLRAPRRPGRYLLFVAAHGRADRATVVVR